MEGLERPAPARSGGLSANGLKGIAIAAMLIDHIAFVFLPSYYSWPALPMHMIGRITGPVMFYFIAEGYHRSRNVNRYTLRLLLFAAVSYVPYVWMVRGSMPNADNWATFSVIYTLLLGHLALRALHEVKSAVLKCACIALCFALSVFGDWNYLAILYILLFDVFRGSFRHQAWAYAAVTLMQLLPYAAQLLSAWAAGMPWLVWQQYTGPVLVYAAIFIPLLLLRFYNGQKGGGGTVAKWGFYVFYPGHMLVLAALRAVMQLKL